MKQNDKGVTVEAGEENQAHSPTSSVPADPLISSSSSGDNEPEGPRCESSSVEVYDGTAVPDF